MADKEQRFENETFPELSGMSREEEIDFLKQQWEQYRDPKHKVKPYILHSHLNTKYRVAMWPRKIIFPTFRRIREDEMELAKRARRDAKEDTIFRFVIVGIFLAFHLLMLIRYGGNISFSLLIEKLFSLSFLKVVFLSFIKPGEPVMLSIVRLVIRLLLYFILSIFPVLAIWNCFMPKWIYVGKIAGKRIGYINHRGRIGDSETGPIVGIYFPHKYKRGNKETIMEYELTDPSEYGRADVGKEVYIVKVGPYDEFVYLK